MHRTQIRAAKGRRPSRRQNKNNRRNMRRQKKFIACGYRREDSDARRDRPAVGRAEIAERYGL